MVTLKDAQIDCTVNATSQYRDKTGLSTMATTGSITAGTNSLVVDDALDFRVDDWVIVEIGGESGAGARGTKGVGGTWPALSYANATAMNADTSQTDNKMCWLEDTGNTYYWNDGGNVWVQVPTSDYYLTKVVPRALWAQITNISGTTLTLSKTASVTATNANVYFDNWGILRNLLNTKTSVTIPAGTYYCSDHVGFTDRDSVTLAGAGKTSTILRSPKGCAPFGVHLNSCDGWEITDCTIDHQFKNANYSFRWADGRQALLGVGGYPIQETYRPGGQQWGQGINFVSCSGGTVRRVRGLNCSQQVVTCQYSSNIWAYNCTAKVEDPNRTYIQWQFNWTDISYAPWAGGLVDCDIDSDWIIPGFEAFRATGVTFTRFTSRNGSFSSNTSDGLDIDEMSITIEQDKQYDEASFSSGNPIVNFNSNIGDGYNTVPSTLNNTTLVLNRLNNTGRRPIAISQVETAAPIVCTGTYDSDFTTPKGLINIIGAPSGTNGFEGLAARIGGTAEFEGMRFRGTGPDTPEKRLLYAEGVGATITTTNCIYEQASNPGTGTFNQTGNLTNAAFDALHPGLP